MKNINWPDLIASVIVLGTCVCLYLIQIPYPRDAAFYPLVLIILLAILSTILFIKTMIKKYQNDNKNYQPIEVGKIENVHATSITANKMVTKNAKLLTSLFIYISIMPVIGHLLSTGIFVIAASYLFGMRKPHVSVLTASGLSLAIYVVFKVYLQLPLPEGMIFR